MLIIFNLYQKKPHTFSQPWVVQVGNCSTWEAKAGDGYELQANLGHTAGPWLKYIKKETDI